MKVESIFVAVTFTIICSLQISCATTQKLAGENAELNSTFTSTFITSPTGEYFLQQVDLSNTKIQIVATNKKGPKFLAKKNNAFVAINSTPFTKTGKLVGVHREGGVELSPPVGKYDALCFDSTNTPSICNQQSILDSTVYAFGGFWCILNNGQPVPFKVNRKDSRTAVGFTGDGKTLFVLTTIAGIKSKGLSFQECAEIFKDLGCSYAIQFDGGSSTTLYVKGRKLAGPWFVPRVPSGFGFCLTPQNF